MTKAGGRLAPSFVAGVQAATLSPAETKELRAIVGTPDPAFVAAVRLALGSRVAAEKHLAANTEKLSRARLKRVEKYATQLVEALGSLTPHEVGLLDAHWTRRLQVWMDRADAAGESKAGWPPGRPIMAVRALLGDVQAERQRLSELKGREFKHGHRMLANEAFLALWLLHGERPSLHRAKKPGRRGGELENLIKAMIRWAAVRIGKADSVDDVMALMRHARDQHARLTDLPADYVAAVEHLTTKTRR